MTLEPHTAMPNQPPVPALSRIGSGAKRVLFLNDYPMRKAASLCDAGEYPSQHLWGTRDLRRFGYEVLTFPDSTLFGSPQRARFSVQQLQAWLAYSAEVDIVYSACQFNVWLLARLRRLGLLRKPLVTVVHHPLRGPLQGAGYVAGHDMLLFLGSAVQASAVAAFGKRLPPTRILPWGPDLKFGAATRPSGAQVEVITAGKMQRDFTTLVYAVSGTGWRTAIYGAERNLAADAPRDLQNVELHLNESGMVLDYRALYGRMRQARVVAIPLSEVNALAGLTSVLDAAALGKPVVMTRNRWLDVDVEALGFGRLVEPGDSAGWRAALADILESPAREIAMGQAAAAWAQRCNSETCAQALAGAFDDLLRRQSGTASP